MLGDVGSLFVPEHTHIPVSRRTPFPAGGELPKKYKHTHDPFVALSCAAAATRKLKLGTGIAQAQAAAGGSQAGGIVGETNSRGGALTTAALLKYGGASGAGVAGGIGIGAGG